MLGDSVLPVFILPIGITLDLMSYLICEMGSSQEKLDNWPFSIGPPILSATYLQLNIQSE